MNSRFDPIIQVIPEHRTSSFARVALGATGRFDLVVVQYDMKELLVRPQLSRYQANQAAEAINLAFITWLPDVV